MGHDIYEHATKHKIGSRGKKENTACYKKEEERNQKTNTRKDKTPTLFSRRDEPSSEIHSPADFIQRRTQISIVRTSYH